MTSKRFDFPNARGERLAALLDLPVGEPRAYALFAHCFTCGKDVHAARRIAEGLTLLGIAVLRFDFTGLGSSEGEFQNSDFSSNVGDLVAAAKHLEQHTGAPALLIGHSLGGAAVLAAASELPHVRAIATIGAPSDPAHVTGLFREQINQIRDQGTVEVQLAGRPFRIAREFLDDVANQRLTMHISNLKRALIIFHSPTDELVGIENASEIFTAAKHPKSFVSLSNADHLLSKKADAHYVANVISAWADRYLPAVEPAEIERGTVVVTETGHGRLQQEVVAEKHRFLADEPSSVGGLDSGPDPYDLLLAALGACTSMTMRLYAERKGIPLERASVRLRHERMHASDCETCETKVGKLDSIDRQISLTGPLDAQQRTQLLAIADKCPVHRTLSSEIVINTKLAI